MEELPKILVTFFPQILFLPPTHSLWFFFSPGALKEKEPEVENQMPGGHHTMEFFEMCAALITQLAR